MFSSENKIEHKENCSENHGDSAASSLPRPPSWAEAMKNDNDSQDKQKRAEDAGFYAHQKRVNYITVCINVVGVVGLLATVVISLSALEAAIKSANEARRQANAAINQSRPWLRVDVTFARPILFTLWAGQKHVHMSFKFDLKNFGQSPATNIRIFTFIGQHPGNARQDILEQEQNRVCALAREAADGDKAGGAAAFPGEPKIIESGAGGGGQLTLVD